MKEFDFDELDRAVNSLMTNVPKDSDTPNGDEGKTVTIPESVANSSSSVPVSSISSPAPASSVKSSAPSATPVVNATRPSVATRRTGRFMDVVHPSVGIKPEVPKKTVSRQGATIAAPESASSTETSAAPDVAAKPQAPPVSMPAPTSHQPPVKSDWPDPLDMANFNTDGASKVESPDTKEIPDTPLMPVEEAAPLTSPFLPNTKVAKRPLGGAATADTDAVLPDQGDGGGKDDLTVNDPDDQLPASPPEVQAPLPEELQQDLVAIESGAPKTPPPENDSATEEKEAIPGASEIEAETPEPEAVSKPKDTSPSEAVAPVPSGPVSIPQQYREEPSTGDKESGAIYDTDTYHQPLAHPAKKKSGWWLVMWIILILVVGAGAGAALFFLGII
jgi:hypothetical protein